MSGPVGTCPNCSAPLTFRWSGAVQTVCGSCRSVVVRHDVDVTAIGETSDLPLDSSPIQIGTRGTFDGRAFTVIGRIVYEYEDGGWNEYVVISKGNQITFKVNGLTTVELTDNEASKAAASGILALQLHAGPPMTVQFKDIMLKELK